MKSAKRSINLFESYCDDADIEAVTTVLRRGTYWADGPEIQTFEERLAAVCGCKHALAFNSGTTALYSLFLALDVTSGEVIVPSFTFPATVNSVVAAGATPVFADIEANSLSLAAQSVESCLTEQTKAIVPIHFAGDVGCEMGQLAELASQRNVLLLEDNAHSICATRNGKQTGTYGTAAMLSFCFNKVLPTGEGGAIVTDSDELVERLRLIRAHGRSPSTGRDYVEVGFNFRLPTMLAALGISQLEKLPYLVGRRREIAGLYNEQLGGIDGLTTPVPDPEVEHVYQLYNVRLESEQARDALAKHLSSLGIPSRVTYYPVHLFSVYRERYGCKEGQLPVTEQVSRTILSLPIHLGLCEEDLQYITDGVKSFFDTNRSVVNA